MNNLDIVLALFTTPNHRLSRLDTTAAFQAATSATSTRFSRTLPKHKTHVFNFTTIYLKEFVWLLSSRCRPKIVRSLVLALFTTPNHRLSRLDTTAAFQAATSTKEY